MSKIEEIRQRLNRGYTLSIYGTRELLYKQMENDINSLLILFGAIENNCNYTKELIIAFAKWLREVDTPEQVEEWFGFTDEDMLNYFTQEVYRRYQK